MASTTPTLIEEIIDIIQGRSLTPFIDAACLLVAEHCIHDPPYDANRITKIETWLAAHFYTVFDPRIVSGTAGDIRIAFQSKVELGLFTSHYGQHAMLLCPELANLNRRLTAKAKPVPLGGPPSVCWLGTEKVTVS